VLLSLVRAPALPPQHADFGSQFHTPSNRCLRFGPRVTATPARLAPVLPARLWTDQTFTGKLIPAFLSHPASGSRTRLHAFALRATPSAVSEHLSEFIGCPISRSFTTYCVCLELRSLPSTGVTRLPRYYEPLRHPRAPSPRGRPVGHRCPRLGASRVSCVFLVYMPPPLPRRSVWAYCFAHSPSRISLPRKGCRVGLRIVLFEDCSAFTRVAACTLALSPIRDTLIEGFSHFVTSMTAPIASGWSGCRVGLAPTGKRRLSTAHTLNGHPWL
jgi:hypothetical protein